MCYHDNRPQYPVEVAEPNPVFAKVLQQSIVGIEGEMRVAMQGEMRVAMQGEMRVAMQYLFQAAAVPDVNPIPASFPQGNENGEFNDDFLSTSVDRTDDPQRPWTSGDSPDDRGEFSFINQLDLEGGELNVPSADPPDVQRTNVAGR